jgi:hypothetical protein
MNALSKFLLNHSLTSMLVGFSISFLCVLTLILGGRYVDYMLNKIATYGTITGVAIYITGRISLIINNRNKKMHRNENIDEL